MQKIQFVTLKFVWFSTDWRDYLECLTFLPPAINCLLLRCDRISPEKEKLADLWKKTSNEKIRQLFQRMKGKKVN